MVFVTYEISMHRCTQFKGSLWFIKIKIKIQSSLQSMNTYNTLSVKLTLEKRNVLLEAYLQRKYKTIQ